MSQDLVSPKVVLFLDPQLRHCLIVSNLSSRLDSGVWLVNRLAIYDNDRESREWCSHDLPAMSFLSFRTFGKNLGRFLLSLIILLALYPARVDSSASNALLDLLSLLSIRLCYQDRMDIALLRSRRIRRHSLFDLPSTLVACNAMVLLKDAAEELQRRRGSWLFYLLYRGRLSPFGCFLSKGTALLLGV